MGKKLTAACLAIAALAAFALPATASAVNDPDLTPSKGAPLLAVGTALLGTNVGNVKVTDLAGKVLTECSIASLQATLTKNNGSEFEATISSVTFSGTGAAHLSETECTGGGETTFTFGITGGLPWCLKSNGAMPLDNFAIVGGKCGEKPRAINLAFDSTTIGECKYLLPFGFPGTFITEEQGDAILTMGAPSEEKLESENFFCPAAAIPDWSFTLEKNTLPILTADPLYIS
jgi:hypothetical protein